MGNRQFVQWLFNNLHDLFPVMMSLPVFRRLIGKWGGNSILRKEDRNLSVSKREIKYRIYLKKSLIANVNILCKKEPNN